MPFQLSISDYHYELPPERIAKYPLEERDASRLLIYKGGKIREDVYRNITKYLPEGSRLFFNDTKVIRARLFFKNSRGGKIEIFCLDPAAHKDLALCMSSLSPVRWNCMIGGLSKWKDEKLSLETGSFKLNAALVSNENNHPVVEFSWSPAGLSFAEILDACGALPIPPYLKRETEHIDLDRYQTLYAKHEGSVAAPTAGLHFTDRIFDSLLRKNILPRYLTLHVGAGTFKPVKSEQMRDHEMHAETIDVKREMIEDMLKDPNPFRVAVGTTSLRTLESLYWLGLKLHDHPGTMPEELVLTQWEPYQERTEEISADAALQSLLLWMDRHGLGRLLCSTSILIAPGYRFRLTHALVTNFHQPGSTLILLVAAAVGNDWKRIYAYALEQGFRFLSYGDGSLLFLPGV